MVLFCTPLGHRVNKLRFERMRSVDRSPFKNTYIPSKITEGK